MKRWVFAVVGVVGIYTPLSMADSIWQRRDPRYAMLFQDNFARNIGDILTVDITEATTNNEREARALDKGSNATGALSLTTTRGSSGGTTGGINYTDNFRRQFAGSAELNMNRVFTDRMAVTVVDMMPNGNLVVEGYRSRVVAGEERVLKVTGIVRQADIRAGNIVESRTMANFRISYLGRGPESRNVNQNVVGRVMNVLWP
jgi:flagellar L-ring protein precursor FlgH